MLILAGAAATALAQPAFNKAVTRAVWTGAPENTLYAVSNGLFRSKDNGQTWTALYLREAGFQQPGITRILIHPANARTVYVFTSGVPAKVWKTTDGGDRWTDVSAGLPTNLESFTDPYINTRNPDTLYLLADDDVYVTRNGGGQWTLLTTLTRGGTVTGQASGIGFAAAPSATGRLYSWSGANILRSDDDGVTWRSLPIIRKLDGAQILDAAVNPRNADELVLIAQYYVNGFVRDAATMISLDGGNSWVEKAPKGTAATLEIDPFGRYHYFGCCGDYCRSDNQAASWNCTALGQGPRSLSFDPQTASLVYYGESNGVSRSTNGGDTRTVITGTARPTLERPDNAPRLALQAGTTGTFTLPVRSVEHDDWRLPFTISDVPSWLQLSVISGNTPASITATIDTSNLPVGTHTAELTLRSPEATVETKWPLTVVVTPVSAPPAYTSATIAGGGTVNAVGFSGPGTQALLSPRFVAVEASGNVVVYSSRNTLHRIDKQGGITHIAGTGVSGTAGENGPATSAQLGSVVGTASAGADVYVAQNLPTGIRKISGGTISTAATSQQLTAAGGGIGRLRSGRDNTIIWVTSSAIHQYSPASQRVERILAGLTGVSYDDVAVAPGGGYYVLDSSENQVYLVRANTERRLVAGSGLRGFAGDSGPATQALLNAPNAIAVGADGTLFISDNGNLRVRAVGSDGIIRTYAGDGRRTGSPTGGLATQMPFEGINDIATTASGDLIVADVARVYRLTRAQSVPAISSGGFVHQSTYQTVVAPGGYFSIFGMNLASTTEIVSSATWPTTLAGVQVRVQGRLAPLYYVSPTQINGQMPYETTPGDGTATVTTAGVTTNVVTTQVRTAAPGILVVVANGAAPGDYVVAYATGVGPVDGQPATGEPAGADPLPQARSAFSATIGGQPANVLYLGLTPGFVGLAQANVVIPDLPAGDYPLVITVDGVASNAATVQVR